MRRVPRISSLVGMPGPLFAIVWYAAAIILATGLTGCRIVGNHDNGVDITSIPRTGVISGKITASQALPLLSLRATVRADFDVDHAYVWLVENNLLAAYTDASGAFFISEVPLTATAGFHVVARFEVGEGNERKTYKIKSGEVSVKQDEPEQDAGTLELMIADKRVHGVLRGPDGSPIRNARLELWGESFQTGPNGEFETPPLPDLDVPIEKIEIKEALGFKPTSVLATLLNWAYYNTADKVAYIFNGTIWMTLAQDGLIGPQGPVGPQGPAGPQGPSGTSIVWKGSLAAAPASPQLNWAYYDTTYRKSYIWDGATWQILAQDGLPPGGTVDTTPPTILAFSVSKVSSTSVVFEYDTNEDTMVQVEYGSSLAYGQVTTWTYRFMQGGSYANDGPYHLNNSG